jgi:hypothetical protein
LFCCVLLLFQADNELILYNAVLAAAVNQTTENTLVVIRGWCGGFHYNFGLFWPVFGFFLILLELKL